MSDITTRAGKGEPLTHNEVDANFTNLNADKYQAGDNPSFGNITVTGTVDGRDVAADGSKLDGIEALADVTDTANVTSAGALMDSEVTNLAAVKAFDPTDYVDQTSATGSAELPAGTTGERDGTPSAGYLRFNTSDGAFEGYDGSEWGALGGSGTPIGAVIYVAKSTAPDGFLKANGAAVSRTTYSDLFSEIGTTFGAGDGSTTFNLPDLRGEFIRGFDDGRGVDSGRSFGSSQLDQMQRLTGSFGDNSDTGNATFSATNSNWTGTDIGVFSATQLARGRNKGAQTGGGARVRLNFDSANSPNARVSSTTSGETRSRNVALLACIKY